MLRFDQGDLPCLNNYSFKFTPQGEQESAHYLNRISILSTCRRAKTRRVIELPMSERSRLRDVQTIERGRVISYRPRFADSGLRLLSRTVTSNEFRVSVN